MAPEPVAIGGVFVERKSEGFESCDLAIEVVAFEIENDVVRCRPIIGYVDGKRRISVRALKTGISRQRINNKDKAELCKKLGRFDRSCCK